MKTLGDKENIENEIDRMQGGKSETPRTPEYRWTYDGEFNFVANSVALIKFNFVEKSICVHISGISGIGGIAV